MIIQFYLVLLYIRLHGLVLDEAQKKVTLLFPGVLKLTVG
jgi:hypothetical protein